jgi:hypothetical protein
VDLDDFIIRVFCLVDDELQSPPAPRPLRSRGPAPLLADSEVVTMELVGEFLGLDQDLAIYAYFRRHYAHFFPAIGRVHRTTFVRQAANLWQAKEWLWQRALRRIPHDEQFAIVDSLPIPVCQFARAYRCRRFRGEAAFGKDIVSRQTFYGFRLHARLCWPGVITRYGLAPANVHDLAMVPALVERTGGVVVGDRNYWAPSLAEELSRDGLVLLAPYRWASRDPNPRVGRFLSRIRYRIDTVFGQLAERYHAKRVWAKDHWHLANRVVRKVLSHTIAVLLTTQSGAPPLRLERLVAA